MFARSTRQQHKAITKAALGTEWGQFVRYLSPALLDVMPMTGLLRQARQLASNASNGRRFATVKDAVLGQLTTISGPVEMHGEGDVLDIALLSSSERRELGRRVLEIYFAQLFHAGVCILDLRAQRFRTRTETLVWLPRPLYVEWDAEFLSGVRDLYRGFYLGDDVGFARGVRQLNLGSAGHVLRSHFGGDDQRRVRFSSEVFHSTFQEAFTICRDERLVLHPNFIALGMYLACLYDALETLAVELDVRGAFDSVHG